MFEPAVMMPDGTTGSVPYDFLDAGRDGVGVLVVTVLVITAVLLAIASTYVAVSRRRAAAQAAA